MDPTNDPGVEIERFERIGVWRTYYHFRIVDTRNHEILAASQRYKTEVQRDNTSRRLAALLGCRLVDGEPR